MALIAVAVLVWIALGLVVAVRMARAGHTLWVWLPLACYGPLAALLAISARQEDAATPQVAARTEGDRGPGSRVVVVGVDGSEGSRRAIDDVLALLGEQVGRLVVATVVDYDAARVAEGSSRVEQEARELLATEAERVAAATGSRPATALLTGSAAGALEQHARDEGADLLVVGARGQGATHLVLGSVAERLARGAAVPVMVAATRSPTGPAPTGPADEARP